MTQEVLQILLVEDNPKDVKLTLHALREENLGNTIQVARDGEEALDFLFCRGEFAGRSFDHPPRLVLLDLKLPEGGWPGSPARGEGRPAYPSDPGGGAHLLARRK